MHDAIKVPINNIFETVLDLGTHNGNILDLCVGVNKNIIGSLGEDKVVNFWSFNGTEIQGLLSY